jgi:SAM-dependent methyltransferase
MPERASADFDRYSGTYRRQVEESIAFAGTDLDFFTRAKVNVLLEMAGSVVGRPSGLSFIDVGCGPGETDRFLARRVGGLAGVDVSPKMVRAARLRNPDVDYRDFHPGGEIPFADASFDVCFAICVLHHVVSADRPALVAEMKRVCRPGGAVVVFEHNPLNPLTRRAVRDCEFDEDAELLSRRRASRLLRNAGLREPAGRYILFFPRDSRLLRRVQRGLGWLPLGAQYAVFAQRP